MKSFSAYSTSFKTFPPGHVYSSKNRRYDSSLLAFVEDCTQSGRQGQSRLNGFERYTHHISAQTSHVRCSKGCALVGGLKLLLSGFYCLQTQEGAGHSRASHLFCIGLRISGFCCSADRFLGHHSSLALLLHSGGSGCNIESDILPGNFRHNHHSGCHTPCIYYVARSMSQELKWFFLEREQTRCLVDICTSTELPVPRNFPNNQLTSQQDSISTTVFEQKRPLVHGLGSTSALSRCRFPRRHNEYASTGQMGNHSCPKTSCGGKKNNLVTGLAMTGSIRCEIMLLC